jgi:hypothetical protein
VSGKDIYIERGPNEMEQNCVFVCERGESERK